MGFGEESRKKKLLWEGLRQKEPVSQGALKRPIGQNLESEEAAGDRAKELDRALLCSVGHRGRLGF